MTDPAPVPRGTVRSDVVRQVGQVLVDRTKHPDGTTWYAAWEPAGSRRYGEARTIDGAAYGRVDTRQHPKPTDLPSDPAGRVGAITSWELAQREKAYEMIRRAFPETAEGFRARGRVHFIGDPDVVLAAMERRRGKGKKVADPAESTREHAPTFAGSGGADD